MTPEETVKFLQESIKRISEAKSKAVVVGLPKEKVGSRVYGDGMTVIDIGAIHEFGTATIPRRSFLRDPFSIREDELAAAIAAEFSQVIEQGKPVTQALGVIGVQAQSISQEAFTTRGFGAWPDISPETKQRKGSGQTLIDTGLLRQSITWQVRNN